MGSSEQQGPRGLAHRTGPGAANKPTSGKPLRSQPPQSQIHSKNILRDGVQGPSSGKTESSRQGRNGTTPRTSPSRLSICRCLCPNMHTMNDYPRSITGALRDCALLRFLNNIISNLQRLQTEGQCFESRKHFKPMTTKPNMCLHC